MMPPAWKVRRELWRVWDQVTHWPVQPFETLYFALHKWAFPSAVKAVECRLKRHKKSAIFLIYQPQGLHQSTLDTCKHLDANGYDVNLVSNAPLSPSDLDQLGAICHRIIQRPNHGYDFGGYQHAIKDIFARGEIPERMLLLNDSIWFPLTTHCTLLQRLERLESDLAGPVYYRHRKHHKSHLQSYMILLSKRAVKSDAFRRFWDRYAMSNSRNRTIRNGEMRLTEACTSVGLSAGYLHEAFTKPAIGTLNGRDLEEVAAYDIERLAESQSRRKFPAPEGDADLIDPLEARYILTNHPVVNFQLLDLPLLKKDRDVPYRHQRKALKDHFLKELKPVIRAEVVTWDRV